MQSGRRGRDRARRRIGCCAVAAAVPPPERVVKLRLLGEERRRAHERLRLEARRVHPLLLLLLQAWRETRGQGRTAALSRP
jgi:hypothetical protein